MMRALICHLTQDVFEHLFDPAAAFREIARTLQPGGAHVFTTLLVRKTSQLAFVHAWRLMGLLFIWWSRLNITAILYRQRDHWSR